MITTMDFFNYYKEKLLEINLSAEIFNLVEDIVKGLESLTYIINEKHYVNMFFIPDTEEQFEKIRLLQFTCLINCSDYIKNNQLLLLKLLNKKNTQLPIGSIIYTDEHQLVFKYIYATDAEQPIESKLFNELVILVNSVIEDSSTIFNQYSEDDLNGYLS
jgi:hypothetical protein